ncbi:hypothetical protein CS369_12655 [Candidatus Symbiopectobacterium sp. 'North America']|uniref:phage tail protein n=1 Tax=Candidatus Symbiopectobacterium sp. 'North America' TaxID=2794574 RepID=UPI0018C924E1|nr:phage tail protein [Candidatus Symbiopectobacterium sp. 'North America']MBG6245415.1 hypothetical protein [Candidatus Symbiopectobacterium sp. 'North America']
MSTKYFVLLTNIGAARLANATALGSRLDITHMAVGDGGGVLPTPNPAQTKLINEKRRAAINSLRVDPDNANQIIAEQVIPENEGGFWIRELGLFDAEGNLIAVANCAETYKPQLQEGSGRIQTVRMILIVSSTETVSLKIDPAVVLATRGYVDSAVIEVKAYADNVMKAHLAAADPHTQYAPKASPALTGTPTAPTASQTVNNTQIATTAFAKAAIAALVASSPAALDTLDELAAALGDDPNFSTTVLNAIAVKLGKTETAASATKLATARKINGVVFDGTTDIKLDLGLSLKVLAQFSTETWIQVNLTAINANTVTMTIDDASRGLYVVPGQTQVVLCENAATNVTVSGVSYTRFNMLGRFAIPSAPTKNADGSTTYTITYPGHGIVVGQQKTVRLGSFVYRELGYTYQGQASNQDGLVYHHKIVLNSVASGINVPVIGYATPGVPDWSSPGVNNAGAVNAIGWDIFPRDNYGSHLSAFMSTPSLLLASTNYGTQPTASHSPMVTVIVYDFV